MADRSAIEWTEATWNPVHRLRQGLARAARTATPRRFAERWRGVADHPYEQGFDLRLWPERLEQPLRWRRPRMIFVNSMSDLFHERHPRRVHRRGVRRDGERRDWHTFQVLTKRPERLAEFAPRPARGRANVWLGVSDREPALRPTAPTTCARCRRPCASSARSRCSGR